MSDVDVLERFIIAQEEQFEKALFEIKNGRKETHWIWYIFPTIKNRFADTDYNIKYSISNLDEAILYNNHPILGKRLIEITTELYKLQNKSIEEIFHKPDIKKIKSCMTLFSLIPNVNPIFKEILNNYYDNQQDDETLKLLIN